MKDYSLNNLISEIHSYTTKEYFKEVSSSYFNQNNRAAIVSLYSVLVSDLLDKLSELKEIYNDKTAITILDEVIKKQSVNSKSSEWESYLIDEVYKRTKLIDGPDHSNILALKSLRNLCAHPVIDKNDRLYTPNNEATLGHIKNILNGILIKPPLLSKEILETVLLDLAKRSSMFPDKTSLRSYLKAKYLESLNVEVKVELFRNLWKIVFYIENDECNENRIINYNILDILYEENFSECDKRINKEKKFFSKVSDNESILELLAYFISTKESIYQSLDGGTKELLKNNCSININTKTISWFLSQDYITHLDSLKKWVKDKFSGVQKWHSDADAKTYQKLLNIGFTKNYNSEVIDFIKWRYINSLNYNDADQVFTAILKPFFNKLNEIDFKELCEGVNSNSQACDRRRAIEDHKELKEYIISNINSDFDFITYRNVFE